MKYIIIYLTCIVISSLWIWYEMWSSPLFDENGNMIRESRKFFDLFKNKNNESTFF